MINIHEMKIYWTDNNFKIRRSRKQAAAKLVASSHLIGVATSSINL